MLNLVDHRRSAQAGDEAIGVDSRCIARDLVVQRDDRGGVVAAHDLLGEGALADLPGALHEHHSTVAEGLGDQWAGTALDQHGNRCKRGSSALHMRRIADAYAENT